ncbi:hypothetical protein BH23PAT2_BH23PAT2_00880 [soil metagenome]
MLTSRQKNVLDFVQNFIDENGNFPTLKEIAEGIGTKSISSVHQHVQELVRKDYLKQEEEYGALEVKEHIENNQIPILGTIAAGQPILAIEDSEPQTVTIDGLPDPRRFYALKVAGDSMVDDGIFDGDTVVIKRQDHATDGQTVVAIIDDNCATLKKIYKEKKRFRLQPANQSMLPIYSEEVEIRGIVWEIRRNFTDESTNKNKSIQKWKTLDLFAGIGGIRLGFERAGFVTSFSNDFEAACKITYDLNFPTAKLVVEDLTKIKAKELPKFNFLLGGFPCQAFSIAGYRKGFEDKKGRGNLFFDIARIIKERQPEGFLLENVKNLRTHDGGNTFMVIKEALKELGYATKEKVMNSMEFGNVPQNRERIYIVGFKDHSKTEKFTFPDAIDLTKNINDILEKKVDKKYYYNGKPLYEKLKDDVTERGKVYQWRRQYVRKNKRGVCPTLTANMGMGGHNVPIVYDGKGIRKLTPRECARIQGYPDSYKLPNNLPDSKLYKQIGNSVSVPVIERIAKKMAAVL